MNRIGLIRVLTTRDAGLLNAHGERIQGYFREIEVVSRCIPGHPEGVHDEATFRTAVPLVVNMAKEFEREGFNAVIVSCADDPGVPEARRELRIPVVGAGGSVAAMALSLGERIGVIGITENPPPAVSRILGSRIIAHAQPKGVAGTLDLLKNGVAPVVDAGLYLKSQGVEVIALACTGLSTINAVGVVASATGLVVVDPVLAEGLSAVCAVACGAEII